MLSGANPISQLAFTPSNGFTIVEYYLARGVHIDDFASNLSLLFSNGMDLESTVISCVARRIQKFKGAEILSGLVYDREKWSSGLGAVGPDKLVTGIQVNDITKIIV